MSRESVQSRSIDSATAASTSVLSTAPLEIRRPVWPRQIGKAARKTDNALRGTHDRLRDARFRIGPFVRRGTAAIAAADADRS